MNQRQRIAFTLISLTLLATAALGKSIEERKWIRMESQNFTIHSVLSVRKTKGLLKHLEAVRSLFLAGQANSSQPLVPTVIYALGGNKDFRELGLDPDKYAGLFMAQLRQNTVVIRNVSGMDEGDVIIHEYIHYLLNNVRFPYPKWYQEGYAEYVSTSATDYGRINVGAIDKGRMYALSKLRWLPLNHIIDSSFYPTLNDEEDVYMFYSQSWLLTHYLLNREGGEEYLANCLGQYAIALQDGATEIEAFRKAFGMTLLQLYDELSAYHKIGQYKYFWFPIEQLIGDFEPESTRLSEAEISAELGDLILRLHLDQSEHDEELLGKARQLYDIALQDEQTRARAEIGFAYLLEIEGRTDDAEDYLASGTSLAPGDFYVQLDAAQFWLNRLGDDTYEPDDLASRAEPYLRRALAIDNSNPEAVYTAGKFLLAAGKIEETIRIWTIAAAGAPAVQSLRWELANVLLANDQLDEALTYANDFLLLSHGSEAQNYAAQKLIGYIEQARATQQELPN